MLSRFAAYGFLKNQRYVEPFLLLALAGRGMTFLQIGILVAIRDVTVAILELPSGVLADAFGFRRTLAAGLFSFAAAYFLLGVSHEFGFCVLAMLLWGVGDSFRTGVHKAMILTWLSGSRRSDESTRIYGFTRSWSKIGSAVSVLIGGAIVVTTQSYDALFFATAIPYIFGTLNVLTYPASVEPHRRESSISDFAARLRRVLIDAWSRRPLRRVLIDSAAYDGVFNATKDYIQPVIQIAVSVWLAGEIVDDQGGDPVNVALLTVPVYVVLHLISSVASRQAHHVARIAGSETTASRTLWGTTAALFLLMLIGAAMGNQWIIIAVFIGLHAIQNVWRPIQVTRLGQEYDIESSAGLLSLENQLRCIAAAALAPLVGYAIDLARATDVASSTWPIGVLGLLVALCFGLLRPYARSRSTDRCSG